MAKKSIKFSHPRFVTSAVNPAGYPVLRNEGGEILPEIAVAGRSNVGKSSLLNDLFGSKGLVKTSSVPGKTQLLNFFTVDEGIAFADLPGYGYAQVPIKVRAQWGPMVQAYLEKRESLKLILFLFDIRRLPNADDEQLIQWLLHAQKAMILVLTKIDKVTRQECQRNTEKILRALNLENLHYVHYSTLANVGRKELVAMIGDALADEEEADEGSR